MTGPQSLSVLMKGVGRVKDCQTEIKEGSGQDPNV